MHQRHGDQHTRHAAQDQRHGERHERQRRDEKARADVAEVGGAENQRGQQQLPSLASAERQERDGREQKNRAQQAGERAIGGYLQGNLPAAPESVQGHVLPVFLFERDRHVGVRKEAIQEWRERVAHPDPVLRHPGCDEDSGAHGHDGRFANAPAAFPGDKSQCIDARPGKPCTWPRSRSPPPTRWPPATAASAPPPIFAAGETG